MAGVDHGGAALAINALEQIDGQCAVLERHFVSDLINQITVDAPPIVDFDGVGDGFSFSSYQGKALYLAILSALKVYFGDKETFALLRRRCMEKDFSWAKSTQQYNRMYTEIAPADAGDPIPFEEAFVRLKVAYENLNAESWAKLHDQFTPGWHRVIQIQVTGRANGIL